VIYSLLRSAAGIAVRWYYSDFSVVGADRIPTEGPLLVVVNHPNALVDVLVAARTVPRPLMFTAKATLFENPLGSTLLRIIGVLPLRRASDEASGGVPADPARNARSFDAVADALARSAAVLIFPEGKSHDEPAMAPARTGAARMILLARERGRRGIRVVPIGLVFEQKDRPRSRVVAIVGDPLDADALIEENDDKVAVVTNAIDSALRALTLNYESTGDAERDARVSQALQALLRFEAPAIGDGGGFRERTDIARLLPTLRKLLLGEGAADRPRALAFEADLLDFDRRLRDLRVALEDFSISRRVTPGVLFVAREAAVLLVAGPVAAWGWLNHVLPFRAALVAGKRVRQSAADPAMRTIVAGAAFVLMMYMLQGAIVTLVFGPWWGLAYVASLPLAADINLRMDDRLRRAARRASAYLRFRALPAVHDEVMARAQTLRSEAISLAHAAGLTDLR
jgi:1-acyl-sn-glycerol-3-phosphate acyltransferase